MKKTFQERIVEIMENKNISQADISRATGITQSSLSDYIKGKYQPKQDKIGLIAEALHVSPAYLMGWEDSKDNHSGSNIRYYREQANLTIEDLSARTGIDVDVLKDAESPNSKPEYPVLYAVAQVFNVSPFIFLNTNEITEKLVNANLTFLKNKFFSIGSSVEYDSKSNKYIVYTETGHLLLDKEQLNYFDKQTNIFLKFLLQDFSNNHPELFSPYDEDSE